MKKEKGVKIKEGKSEARKEKMPKEVQNFDVFGKNLYPKRTSIKKSVIYEIGRSPLV